jgi:hypothetical protein
MKFVSVRMRTTRTTAPRRGPLLFIAAIFFGVGIPVFLWYNISFAVYGVSGFSWIHTNGTVTSSRTTEVPTIQFTSRDGPPIAFTEDYIVMCGSRSFCFRRSFDPGQVVPVVYDPGTPTRAYVYDWALFSNTITWFLMAGFWLLFLLLFVGVRISSSTANFSFRIGRTPGAQ